MTPLVMFDNNGFYLGIATHRGETNNRFHWGTPTDGASRMLPPAALANVPGVPQPQCNYLPGSNNKNQVLGAVLIDAPAPINPWNNFGMGGGSGGI